MKRLLPLVLYLVLAVSCSLENQAQIGKDADLSTWGGLFDSWWAEMNANYVFWSLDSLDGEWDDVWREYSPLFHELGDVEVPGLSDSPGAASTAERAGRMFHEIIRNLSDMHHVTYLLKEVGPDETTGEDEATYAPLSASTDNLYDRYGITYEDPFEGDWDPDIRDQVLADTDYVLEDFHGIMENILGEDISEQNLSTPLEANVPNTGLFKDYAVVNIFDPDSGDSYGVFLGITNDGVLYFNQSAFLRSEYENHPHVDTIFRQFETLVQSEETKGLVIDLRGNPGGYTSDLGDFLAPIITSEETTIALARTKESDNRLSYTAWAEYKVSGEADEDFGKPVAVLVNTGTASMGELTALAFREFGKERGMDVEILGSRTLGATGNLLDNVSDRVGAGSFSLSHNIHTVYTPYLQLVTADGESIEGVGLTPYAELDFNSSEFESETDSRLVEAFTSVRSRLT